MKISTLISVGLAFICFAASIVFGNFLQAQDRTILPPPAPEFEGKIGETYKDSTPDFSPALPLTWLRATGLLWGADCHAQHRQASIPRIAI
jgi:hypothetical protein